eukprot:UN02330
MYIIQWNSTADHRSHLQKKKSDRLLTKTKSSQQQNLSVFYKHNRQKLALTQKITFLFYTPIHFFS